MTREVRRRELTGGQVSCAEECEKKEADGR